jgi:hypothetical protein
MPDKSRSVPKSARSGSAPMNFGRAARTWSAFSRCPAPALPRQSDRVRATRARCIFSAHETSWIMLTGCYLTLSQCCLRSLVMVDLRRIASERIKETPAVLQARAQSEGGNRTGPRG